MGLNRTDTIELNNKLIFINEALTLIGVDNIKSLLDTDTHAKRVFSIYDTLIDNELTLIPWKFAHRSITLQRLDPTSIAIDDNNGLDLENSSYYAIPQGVASIHGVKVNNSYYPYDLQDNFIRINCNLDSNNKVVLEHIIVPSIAQYPAYFRAMLKLRLASELALAVKGDSTLSNKLMSDYESAKLQAGRIDAQQSTNKSLFSLNQALAHRR